MTMMMLSAVIVYNFNSNNARGIKMFVYTDRFS